MALKSETTWREVEAPWERFRPVAVAHDRDMYCLLTAHVGEGPIVQSMDLT
jgi:hypothetical protein